MRQRRRRDAVRRVGDARSAPRTADSSSRRMRAPSASTASSAPSRHASPRAWYPSCPTEWRARHEWGRAYGAHCLVLALDRPLTSVYWLNVNDPGFPVHGAGRAHELHARRTTYGGRHLIYLGNYRPMDDPLMTATQDEVLDEFLPHLARINTGFERSWVTDAWSFAAPFAQPIVTVGLPRSHPAVHHADPELVDGEHVPGLSARSRAELLDRARRAARGAHRRLGRGRTRRSPAPRSGCRACRGRPPRRSARSDSR